MFNWFKKKNNVSTIYWNSTSIYPENNEEIVIVTIDGDVYSGTFDKKQNALTMYEFLGYPQIEWDYVKHWTKKSIFIEK